MLIEKLTPAQWEVYGAIPVGQWVSTPDINEKIDYTRTTILRALERLFYLHMVHRDISTIPYRWMKVKPCT